MTVIPLSPSTARFARLGAIYLPVTAAAQPVMAWLPAILARDFGLSLALVGSLYLAGQLFNSVLDPVVGALSDRTRSRFGCRRPWIAAGGVLFTGGSAMLFFPPDSIGAAWLVVALAAYYSGLSLISTPLLAWSGEVAPGYHDRTRAASTFTLIQSVALVAALGLAAIAQKLQPGDGRLQLTLFGLLVLASAVPALWLTLTTREEKASPLTPALSPVTSLSPSAALRAVFGNALLLRVLASDAAVRAGQGIRTTLLLFYVTFYLGRPEWAAGLFLFQYAFGMLAAPIWQRIGVRLGKRNAAILAEVLQALINLALVLTTPDLFWLVLLLAFAQGLTQGSGNIMLRSMVADVADKHRVDTGEERAGLYYSVFGLADKIGGALAAGIALPLIAWFGFDPKATNTPQALDGLLLVFALGPALAHAISAAVITGFSLDADQHNAIRLRLNSADDPALQPAE
ncbi:MFS transporter [Novosphingobium sp. MMS21-SN21R]|uniref:MFS transporter n=1 Tax=Novosphingobium sp. MMS21-SN21R TaxID=2969298 RepID=UPI0028875A9F|nr:MFS transporter [Novosphingobium sp. MMS21-SN21R]MDT0509016.1 MFS transporter [Novosphingobium sp. MMS21-SN21R]